MKTAERIVMVAILLILVGSVTWLYFILTGEQVELREAVARGEYEIFPAEETVLPDEAVTTQESWRQYYPVTVPITIGKVTVAASVADTLPERIKGLSDTPYLPEGIVKLFVFGTTGTHSIWMKDMNYSIDIIWVSEDGVIVHLEENVSPDTYPNSVVSPTPAWYVIEANAGFIQREGIVEGDNVKVVLPS